MNHLESNNILTDMQHGFCKGCSWKSQLILTVHNLAKRKDDKVQIDSVFLDFSKVFEKVICKILSQTTVIRYQKQHT